MATSSKEVLKLIGQAVVEDTSLETGATRMANKCLLVEVLPRDAESPAEAVTRCRDLIVEALNSDRLIETGNAVPLGEQRFRLDMIDSTHWIGSVAAFVGSYLNDLAAYWPDRAKGAPGEVFAVRLVKIMEHGAGTGGEG
jgi:hypothetical protein